MPFQFQYITANIELTKQYLQEENHVAGIKFLEYTQKHPYNLKEGKLSGTQENDIHYLLAVNDKLGNTSSAQQQAS